MKKSFVGFLIVILVFTTSIYIYFKYIHNDNSRIVIPSVSFSDSNGKYLSETVFIRHLDFDSLAENSAEFDSGFARTGKYSCKLTAEDEYGFGYNCKWSEITNYYIITGVEVTTWVYSESDMDDVLMVFEADSIDGTTINWQSQKLTSENSKWKECTVYFDIPNFLTDPENAFKLYIWNKSREDFYIDDFTIRFKGTSAAPGLYAFSNSVSGIRTFSLDFESKLSLGNDSSNLNSNARSGKYSFLFDADHIYSPSVSFPVSAITGPPFSLVTMGLWLNPEQTGFEVVLVATLKKESGEEYFWEGRSSDRGIHDVGKWSKHRAQFKLPFESMLPGDIISVYAWNKGRTRVLIDDFTVVFGDQSDRAGNIPFTNFAAGDTGFYFKRNQLPFKTVNYLLSDHEFSSDTSLGNIYVPDNDTCYDILSGNFTGSLYEQVIFLCGNEIYLVGFDKGKGCINLLNKSNILTQNRNSQYLVADVDFDNIDELLIFNTGKCSVYKYNSYKKSNTDSFIASFHEINVIDIPDNADLSQIQILRSDKSYGFCFISNYSGSGLVIDAELKVATVIRQFGSEKNMRMKFLLSEKSKYTDEEIYYFLVHNDNTAKINSYILDNDNRLVSKGINEFLPVSFVNSTSEVLNNLNKNAGKSKIVVYTDFPRFSLLSGAYDFGKFYLDGRIELEVPLEGLNPKYSEYTKVLLGKFTPGDEDQLFIYSANYSGVNHDYLNGVNLKNLKIYIEKK